ncbi:MAG TPA: M50 family metallopeptidase [Solirubrobacterales bacterium]|jgi:regulator of sigma E protease
MSWLLVFLGLCFLVIIHEAGHFVAAKATGMRVERFFLFFGPTIWSFRRGETEYGVKSIPLGGYVKISGMTPEEEIPPEVRDRAYYRQPVWKRIVVIGAGPATNIAFAIALLFVLAVTSSAQPSPKVAEILPNTPASGILRPGDVVLAIDGRSFPRLSGEARINQFRAVVASHECAGEQVEGCRAEIPVILKIKRGKEIRNVKVRPEYNKAVGQARIGFVYGSEPDPVSIRQAFDRATGFAWRVTRESASRIAKIFDSRERSEIHGIVGVSDVGHDAVGLGLAPALTFLAVISLSLGVINLFPFLPLDGGHIFWGLIEKLRGRRVSLRTMELASVVGFALVAILFVIGLSNDLGALTGEGFNVH